MSNVFVDVGMSLDGFLAGLNGGAKNPLGEGGIKNLCRNSRDSQFTDGYAFILQNKKH